MYRYDTETGLYYLQSRYYNPSWGRFVNADGLIGQTGDLLGHNIFAYCKNNAVTMKDPDGFLAIYSLDEAEEAQYEAARSIAAVAHRNSNIESSSSGHVKSDVISSVKTGAFPSAVDSGTACAVGTIPNPIREVRIPQQAMPGGGISPEFITYRSNSLLTVTSGAYKYVGGAATLAALGYSVWDDYHHSHFTGRIIIDGGGAAAGVLVGLALAPLELPLAGAILAGASTGFALSMGTSAIKRELYGD